MGDGVAKESGLLICTDSFSIEDTVRLINVFIIKYRLNCNLSFSPWPGPRAGAWAGAKREKGQYRIYIQQNSMADLYDIVSPHMQLDMLYKLNSALKPKYNYNSIGIEVIDLKQNTTTFYPSMSQAAKTLNISTTAIVNFFIKNQIKPHKSRYLFKKVEK